MEQNDNSNKDIESNLLSAGLLIASAAAGGAILRKLIGGSSFTSALAQISGALIGGVTAKKILDSVNDQSKKGTSDSGSQ
jgi:outer membrane lipoprotein SlyB